MPLDVQHNVMLLLQTAAAVKTGSAFRDERGFRRPVIARLNAVAVCVPFSYR